ncbi:DUF6491 family protein [uncultured Umboniibacter sp.]|uniref:DUF6491 family protein n=1 Tax=uncultured Umboniibacter sp. TaxID=1798917 RepID=UPI002621A898|nr:DUF6491 family protein [uncultured Umboniibacter sp.]
MKKYILLLIATVVISGCSNTSQMTNTEDEVGRVQSMYESLPERYKVPGLEPLERVNAMNISGWAAIDQRSFILTMGPSTRYLVVLQRQSSELRFANAITIDNFSSSIRPGFDSVNVVGDTLAAPYQIEAMFELEDREAANAARDYIRDWQEPEVVE